MVYLERFVSYDASMRTHKLECVPNEVCELGNIATKPVHVSLTIGVIELSHGKDFTYKYAVNLTYIFDC